MINPHGGGGEGGEVPKVADFLGVNKSENHQTDYNLVPYNDIHQTNDSDYYFQTNSLLPTVVTCASNTPNNYHELQESAHNLQSLTLSMGSTGAAAAAAATVKASPGETSADNSSSTTNTSGGAIVEATPRRTLETFGQRTSIYRGVTRS